MLLFVAVNTAYPAIVMLLLTNIEFSIPFAFWFLIVASLVLLIVNIRFFITQPHHRSIISIVSVANILSLIFLSHVGLSTAIFDILDLIFN